MAGYLQDLYGFKEKKFFSLTHAVRVYIYGVEVTEWLKGAVTVNYATRDSFNTCSFELSNPRQIWQITYANSPYPSGTGVFRSGSEYSEQIKKQVFDWKNDPTINPVVNLNIKSTMNLDVKPFSQSNLTSPQAPKQLASNQERKYRLNINDCIFNKHDPVRVFIRNPYANRDEWMEVFCGYVHSHPITTNWLNGESSVRFDCYCVRQMMMKMRVTHNIRSNNSSGPIFDEGFYADFAKVGETQNHAFAQTNLETAIKQLVIGDNYLTNGKSQLDTTSGRTPNARGIGWFSMGNTVCYNPTKDEHLLERWHLMTIFGCHKSGFPSPSDQLWLTNDEVTRIGEETLPFDLSIGGPDSRYLHFLLPTAGTGASDLTTHAFDGDHPAPEPSWTTRWDIIREFAAALDFQVMTSPSGDILVEFPQYGFMPSAYGTGSIPVIPFAAAPIPQPDQPGAADVMDNAGGLSAILTFNLHQKEETLNDEAEDFPTVLTVTGSMANQNLKQPDNPNVGSVNKTGYVYSPVLVARYGVIGENIDFPYLGQTQETENSPSLTTRLARLGTLEFTKRMANASTLDTSIVYRPLLFPNRPVWLKRSHRAGVLTSVQHTWNIKQDATTQISMNMLMAERSDHSYRPLQGSANMPIDYLSLWGATGSQDVSNPEGGIRTSVTDTVKPSASETTQSPKPSTDASGNAMSAAPATTGGADFNGLYPYLKTKISKVVGAWNKAHPSDPVQITSGYRSEQNQAYLYQLYKSGKGNPANPPGTSWHEWGLACDMVPMSAGSGVAKNMTPSQKASARVFADFVRSATANDTDGPLIWKGEHDPVHYQPSENYWNINTNMMQNLKAANASNMGGDSYKAVWLQLDQTLLKYNIKPAGGTPLVFAPASPNTPSSKVTGGFRPTKSGTEENQCNPDLAAEPTLQRVND